MMCGLVLFIMFSTEKFKRIILSPLSKPFVNQAIKTKGYQTCIFPLTAEFRQYIITHVALS